MLGTVVDVGWKMRQLLIVWQHHSFVINNFGGASLVGNECWHTSLVSVLALVFRATMMHKKEEDALCTACSWKYVQTVKNRMARTVQRDAHESSGGQVWSHEKCSFNWHFGRKLEKMYLSSCLFVFFLVFCSFHLRVCGTAISLIAVTQCHTLYVANIYHTFGNRYHPLRSPHHNSLPSFGTHTRFQVFAPSHAQNVASCNDIFSTKKEL